MFSIRILKHQQQLIGENDREKNSREVGFQKLNEKRKEEKKRM